MARGPNRLELPIHSYSLMSFESLRHALQPRIQLIKVGHGACTTCVLQHMVCAPLVFYITWCVHHLCFTTHGVCATCVLQHMVCAPLVFYITWCVHHWCVLHHMVHAPLGACCTASCVHHMGLAPHRGGTSHAMHH